MKVVDRLKYKIEIMSKAELIGLFEVTSKKDNFLSYD